MTTASSVYGQETTSTPANNPGESLRDAVVTAGGGGGGGGCTTYSIQAVAGVGTAGCAVAGQDFGRRQ